MPDTKITALAAITTVDPAADVLPIVDISDTSMAASGTTKKITSNQILGAGGTATLASATISGDLTVRTTGLILNTSGLGVGISPTSFGAGYGTIQVSGATGSGIKMGSPTNGSFIYSDNTWLNILTETNIPHRFFVNNIIQHTIEQLGVFSWKDGVGGTRMTLNATGLGVGRGPLTSLDVFGANKTNGNEHGTLTVSSSDTFAIDKGGSIGFFGKYNSSSGNACFARVYGAKENATDGSFTGYFAVSTSPSGTPVERFRIDSAGNLGIGVTPSAWAANRRALQVGGLASAALALNGTSNVSEMFFNSFINTSASNSYAVNGRAGLIDFGSGGFGFSIDSGTQTAGAACNFTRAMTLDASGNLLVGTTSALFNSRLRVKTSSTSASDYGMYVADSADALIFALRNDGLIYTGTKTASPYNNTTGSAANAFIAADGTLGRSTSSLKYKTDITDSTRGLADVLKLRPVTYKSKNGDDTIFGGLIAEEVHAAGLTEFVAYAPDNAPDAIHYSNMVSLLVAAIKELTARVQTLEAK